MRGPITPDHVPERRLNGLFLDGAEVLWYPVAAQFNKGLRCRREAAEQGSGVQIPSGAAAVMEEHVFNMPLEHSGKAKTGDDA